MSSGASDPRAALQSCWDRFSVAEEQYDPEDSALTRRKLREQQRAIANTAEVFAMKVCRESHGRRSRSTSQRAEGRFPELPWVVETIFELEGINLPGHPTLTDDEALVEWEPDPEDEEG